LSAKVAEISEEYTRYNAILERDKSVLVSDAITQDPKLKGLPISEIMAKIGVENSAKKSKKSVVGQKKGHKK
jgi:hypothetical protein